MRKARAWFREQFTPSSAEEILTVYRGKTSAPYRMVTTYWNMAAALVLHGAIDEQMFADVNGEHIMVYARLRPFLPELREQLNNPGYLEKLEQVIMRMRSEEHTSELQSRVDLVCRLLLEKKKKKKEKK